MRWQARFSQFDPRGLVVPVLLVGAMEAAALITHLESDTLAAPHAILAADVTGLLDGSILMRSAQTMANAIGGLVIGGSIGLALGIGIGLSRWLDATLDFTIELIRPIPSVALIPLMLLIFGFGYRMEITIIAFTAVWPLLLLTRAAVRSVDPRLVDVARVMRFGFLPTLTKFVLPTVLPRVFVAFRLAMGVALIVAVTVEISVNPLGLGAAMMEAGQALRPDVALSFLVWIALLGWAMDAVLGALYTRFIMLPGAEARQ